MYKVYVNKFLKLKKNLNYIYTVCRAAVTSEAGRGLSTHGIHISFNQPGVPVASVSINTRIHAGHKSDTRPRSGCRLLVRERPS